MAGFTVRQDGSFALAAQDISNEIAGAGTATMKEISTGLKMDLRRDVMTAGLGTRLANTWRGKTFPEGKSRSVDAAAFVWSKAPKIIDAFVRGATIVPINGAKYLAIPTENVPGRGANKKMTPFDVEIAFNQDLQFGKTKNGSLFAYVEAVRAKSGHGFRRATRGRLKQGRQTEAVVMFYLIPRAKMPKLLDLDGKAEVWGEKAIARFNEKLNNL